MDTSSSAKQKQIAKQIASRIDERQRDVLSKWIEQMLELKGARLPAIQKARRAIALTAESKFLISTATLIADVVTPAELRVLTAKLVEIHSSQLTLGTKVAQASSVISKSLKGAAWDNRGLPARIALSGAIAAAVFFGGQGAGIAALGTAIGVPLWVVFGAGGAFLGVLYEEIVGKKTGAKTTYRVIDAEAEGKGSDV